MKRLVLAALLVASSARAQPTQAQFDSLRAEIAQIKTWKAAIDLELGPVVDPGAQTIRARIRELGVAFNGVVARMEGIPGDTRIVDVLREQYSPILTRLPPNNRTVQEYVNSAIASIVIPPPRLNVTGTVAGSVPGFGNGVILKEASGLTSLFFDSDFDRATRLLTNTCADSIPKGHTYCDVTLAQLGIDFEQDGAYGLRYFKPWASSPGPFDIDHPGKALLFRPGGQDNAGRRGPFVQIYGGLVGRGLQIGVARNAPNAVSLFDFNISPTDGTNPISITLGGAERRLKPCTIGGQNVVCWQ